MSGFWTRLAVVAIALIQFTAFASAGTLDDYYLQQFGEEKSLQLQKAMLSASPVLQEPARCGMPLKHGLRRDWNLLEPSTQKVLAKQLALPALSGPEQTLLSSGGHFTIHYTTSGADAPNITLINQYAGLNLTSPADWAATVAATFEYVYTQYGALGYQLAPTTSGTYDVYLNNQASKRFYGVTHSGSSSSSATYPHAVTSWMELDSSFTNDIFKPTIFTPLQSLQVTAAHEYHHAIQYGYNIFFDVWYAEATSTWMEDELYDNVNQLYSYIPAWFTQSTLSLDTPESLSTGGGYGRWIFNRYLSEQHGPAMIRNVWEKVGSLPSPSPQNNADIPMAPVLDSVLSTNYGTSLGNDFFGFSKRVYRRDAWTDHSYDASRVHAYSPIGTYTAYPVNGTASPTPTISLPGYSFAYYKFIPTPGLTSLTFSITKTSGIQITLFKNSTEIAANAGGNATFTTYTASSLVTSDAIVLLIANTTGTAGHNAYFSTDGSLAAVVEPTTPSSSTSGSSGCFIATAAYGSYLHPHVQQLRHVRDEYLLTNAPGRAFVALYYRCSPPLADFIARHPLLRGATRLALTPLVAIVIHPTGSTACLLLLFGAVVTVRIRRIGLTSAYATRITISRD